MVDECARDPDPLSHPVAVGADQRTLRLHPLPRFFEREADDICLLKVGPTTGERNRAPCRRATSSI